MRLDRRRLLPLYHRLYRAYGAQHWWPARSPFEVMVGAVLTQNTNWGNVERAIAALRAARRLHLGGILALPTAELARLIRPCGYFNVKARRLRAMCHWVQRAGGPAALRRRATAGLRRDLLAVHGIGPETADDILLYALQRPVFVIDTYTRRLFARLGLAAGDEDYDRLRLAVEAALGADSGLYNEFHALIVRHAKEKCSNRRACRHCYVEQRGSLPA